MTVRILLIEDEPGPAILIQEALDEICSDYDLSIVSDGELALSRLQGLPIPPHIILLDLNLPKKPGLEVLEEIKADPELRMIPVIILTNSRSQEDVEKAYKKHCNAFVRKPLDFDDLVDALRATGKFWFGIATVCSP